ncbi:MAG TPA: DUF4010 domain-containing protein [Tepidisphaeraceae bacterium]
MDHIPYNDVAAKIAVGLAAGLLVGLEREWAHKEIGVRTFAIVALLGVLTSLMAMEFVFAGLVGVLLLIVFLNVQSLLKDQSLELTTSASLIVVMILGALAGMGHYFTTAASAVVMTALLAWKTELSRFAGGLRTEEIRGAVLLGLLGFVIYPLLPNRFVDPWQLFNPQQAWVIVIVIAGIGFLNYVLLRLYGQKGLYYAALLGGLVNSTAAAAELTANVGTQKTGQQRAVAIVLLTNVSMFLRNLVILAIFAAAAVVWAVGPLAIMAIASMLTAWRAEHKSDPITEKLVLSSPVSLGRVLNFAVIFVLIAAVGTLAERHFGNAGFLVVSIAGGLVSSASTTAAAAALVATHRLHPEWGAVATIFASIASALVNLPIVYQHTRNSGVIGKLSVATGIIVLLGLGAMGAESAIWFR